MAKKSKFPIFVITLVIGLGLIAVAFIQPEFIFGDTSTPFDVSSFVGLSLIEVPIDPTTGQILGTVKFGAPIEVPFDRSGTVLSADGACQSLKDLNDRFKGSEVKFGRLGSGDRNAEVSFHNWNGINCSYGYAQWDLSKLPNDFIATGFTLQLNLKQLQGGQQSCAIGYVDDTIEEIGLSRLPNRSLWGNNEGSFGVTLGNQVVSGSPIQTSLVPDASPIFSSSKTDFLVVGHFVTNKPKLGSDWCEQIGVKRWIFAQIEPTSFLRVGDPKEIRQPLVASTNRINIQAGVDAFNTQLQKGTDKFTIVFYGGSIGAMVGKGANVIDQQWWEENGSLLVTGSSKPIKCNVGFEQVGFRCIAIVCPLGETVDISTNQCAPIQCSAGSTLQIIQDFAICTLECVLDVTTGGCLPCGGGSTESAVCVPDQSPDLNDCGFNEVIVDGVCKRVDLIECQVVLNCNEGFEPNDTGCFCKVKECSLGQELIGDSCQSITCPTNTRLIGNDCAEISCPTGHTIIDNECVSLQELFECPEGTEELVGFSFFPPECVLIPVQCQEGFKAVGNICLPIQLDCPEGTEEFENNCRNIVPSLQVSGIDPTLFLITGLVIAGISGVGIVARRR